MVHSGSTDVDCTGACRKDYGCAAPAPFGIIAVVMMQNILACNHGRDDMSLAKYVFDNDAMTRLTSLNIGRAVSAEEGAGLPDVLIAAWQMKESRIEQQHEFRPLLQTSKGVCVWGWGGGGRGGEGKGERPHCLTPQHKMRNVMSPRVGIQTQNVLQVTRVTDRHTLLKR